MIPILYSATESSFSNLGIGKLTDTLSCFVTEERNGEYELEMTYPSAGVNFSSIAVQNIILAKANQYDDAQPFRIYSVSKPLNGICTINARHISYDLSGAIVIGSVTASNAGQALSNMASHADGASAFTFHSDNATTAEFSVTVPASFRALMGGVEGSVLDVYGGEYHYDKFLVENLASRGANRGYTIRYGKNLIDIEQEEKCTNVYTGVVCYYDAEDGVSVGNIVSTGISLGYTRNLLVNVSDYFEEAPTSDALTDYAQTYIDAHELTTPQISITVSFQQIDEDYRDRVTLCDTVTVFFENLGVNAQAKIVKTVYDTLLERYESISVGSIRNNLADTVAVVQKQAESAPTVSTMQDAISHASDMITGVSGGYVRLNRDANGNPYEILIMNTDDLSTAQYIWRWNENGLGYSDDYGQTYGLAMTSDGQIVADYVNTGILQSGDGEAFYLNLNTGELRMKAADIYLGSQNLADTITQVSENTTDLTQLGNYLTYDSTTGVVTLGDRNSEIALKVENDRVAFVDTANADAELAYFNNSRLMIQDATIINSLDIGGYRIDTKTGGATWRWIE